METETFTPLLTREIPLPIVESGLADLDAGPLPRSLAQVAGHSRATRRVAWTLGAFLLLVILQGALLIRMGKVDALAVYQTGSQARLVTR